VKQAYFAYVSRSFLKPTRTKQWR